MIETIAQLANENDMVIIDLEGTASRMMSRALIRSHLVLVPFNQSPVDAELAAAAVSLIQEEEEAVERKIPFRLVRSRDSAAFATKTSKRITSAIEQAGLPMLPIGVVERAAYRDIYEFGLRLSELDPSQTSGVPKAIEMISQLVEGQEAVVRTARSLYALVEQAHDEATADLLTQRIQLHEKTAWMLRSLLE